MKTKKIISVSIEHDDAVPSVNDDGGWHLYSFSTKHNNFIEPEELGLLRDRLPDGTPMVRNMGLRSKLRHGLAFWCAYYEHSGSVWSLTSNPKRPRCQFDSVSFAGLLVWTDKAAALDKNLGDRSMKARTEAAESFLETYNAWANGDCYGYSIECDEDDSIDESCWSFIGPDLSYMFDEIDAHLKDHPDIVIVLEGDAKDIAQYHWKKMPRVFDDVDEAEDYIASEEEE